MTIKLLFCALMVSISVVSFSQERYPSVVAAGGGESKTTSMVLEWTLGELVTESVVSEKNLYTQGYHQPLLSVDKLPQDPGITPYKIDVFPNPATSVIYVRIGFSYVEPLTIILLDSKGSFLLKKEVAAKMKLVEVNVSRYSHGVYTLQIRDRNGRILQNYQVVKAQ